MSSEPTTAAASGDDERPGAGEGGRVRSLERAIALINRVADAAPEGDTAANLAQLCGINRATAWRLLATMEAHGLVERDPASNRYGVGFAVARLAASAGVDGLVRRAHHIVVRVCEQTGETADLAVARRHGLTYVDEVAPASVLAANWLGRPVPLHATSSGKAFLAWLPEGEVTSLLAGALTPYTDTTIVDRGRLAEELRRTRARGYGVCTGEFEPNLFGVSAPVLDPAGRPYAVFSIWGPKDRVLESRFAALGALAMESATAVARTARDASG